MATQVRWLKGFGRTGAVYGLLLSLLVTLGLGGHGLADSLAANFENRHTLRVAPLERSCTDLQTAYRWWVGLPEVRASDELTSDDLNARIAELQQLASEHPDNVLVGLRLGMAYGLAGLTDSAVAEWRRVGAYGFFINSGMLCGGPTYERALEWYRIAALIRPGSSEPWYRMGIVLEDHQAADEALEAYRKARGFDAGWETREQRFTAYYRAGAIVYHRGNYREAMGYFKEAFGGVNAFQFLNPSTLRYGYLMWGGSLARLDHLAEAERVYRQALETLPAGYDPALVINLGRVLTKQGRWSDAADLIPFAIRAYPKAPGIGLKLLDMLLDQGQDDWASKSLTEIRASLGDVPQLKAREGRLMLLRGDFAAARLFLSQAVEARPDDSYAHFWLSHAHLALGQVEQAQTEAETAVRLAPEERVYRERLQYILDTYGP